MSEFLDELARSLTTKMPRRRAVRVLGGALVGLAVPAAGARAASSTHDCPAENAFLCQCPSINGLFYKICCQNETPSIRYDCTCKRPPDGYAQCTYVCKRPCGKGVCCGDDQECAEYSVSIGGPVRRGCRDKCKPGTRRCSPTNLDCCPRGQDCCGQYCCDPEQECRRGRNASGGRIQLCVRKCRPPKPKTCKLTCCTARQPCCNGKCCSVLEECAVRSLRGGGAESYCRPKCLAGLETKCGDFGCCKQNERCTPFRQKDGRTVFLCSSR